MLDADVFFLQVRAEGLVKSSNDKIAKKIRELAKSPPTDPTQEKSDPTPTFDVSSKQDKDKQKSTDKKSLFTTVFYGGQGGYMERSGSISSPSLNSCSLQRALKKLKTSLRERRTTWAEILII